MRLSPLQSFKSPATRWLSAQLLDPNDPRNAALLELLRAREAALSLSGPGGDLFRLDVLQVRRGWAPVVLHMPAVHLHRLLHHSTAEQPWESPLWRCRTWLCTLTARQTSGLCSSGAAGRPAAIAILTRRA